MRGKFGNEGVFCDLQGGVLAFPKVSFFKGFKGKHPSNELGISVIVAIF